MGKFFFTCSFDDGDVADKRLADLLLKYNVKGTFYVPRSCDLVAKSLSNQQIRELSDWVEIGGHTLSHQVLTKTTREVARQEIFDCKSWLEDTTGKPVKAFCPPTGRFDRYHVLLQHEAGFNCMRTVEMLSYSTANVEAIEGVLVLPTTNQVFHHTSMAYLKNIVKRLKLSAIPTLTRTYHSNWGQMSANLLAYISAATTTADFVFFLHLWGHSWEIEKYSLWNSLEHFLQVISNHEGVLFCTNSELAEIVRREMNHG